VELVTDRIEAVTPNGILTAGGTERELDVLVLATGFHVDDFILPTEVYGENGLSLREFWNELPRAHRAMTFPGFPNFWMLEGPTGVFGNTSLIDMSEHQIGYMIACLNHMRDGHFTAIAPKREAFDAYNDRMAKEIVHSTWATGGCDSWYLDKSGRPNIYPWLPDAYREEMKHPDFTEYRLTDSVAASVA
jgi:cation diffusion facilitator CzcD-associated flavoprotein CzcO